MTFRRFGTFVVDVERVFAVNVVCHEPYTVKAFIIGAPAIELTGEAALELIEDVERWLE